MTETFAALFAAHVVADFLLQTRGMVEAKHRIGILILHVAIVFATALVALGFTGWVALAILTAAHGLMDAIKTYLLPHDRLWTFLLDQAVHIITLISLATALPGLITSGLWGRLLPDAIDSLTLIYLVAGFAIFTVQAGSFAVKLILNGLETKATEGSVPAAGQRIGQLERGLVFLLILIGHPEGIAFLIAAKSVLRFGDVQQDRAASEIVIVGTLASVAWAMLSGAALLFLLPDAALEMLRRIP
jgi:hypothetical protein